MSATVATTHLPAPKQVRDLVAELVDKDVELRPCPPFAVAARYPGSVGVFVDDHLVVRAVVALDLSLSAHVAAALALVPRTAAQTAIEEGKLTELMAESLREVFNIIASIFNVGESAHLRLHACHVSGEVVPFDSQARTQVLGRREDFLLDVAGYGAGRIAIVLS